MFFFHIGEETSIDRYRGRGSVTKARDKDLVYLAYISNKYSMDLNELLNSMRIALDHGKFNNGRLEVQYRGRVRERPIFLILLESKVVAQLSLADNFFQEIVHSRELLKVVKR